MAAQPVDVCRDCPLDSVRGAISHFFSDTVQALASGLALRHFGFSWSNHVVNVRAQPYRLGAQCGVCLRTNRRKTGIFSLNTNAIDDSPVRRYSSRQKKGV